jgi:hypothetical protein
MLYNIHMHGQSGYTMHIYIHRHIHKLDYSIHLCRDHAKHVKLTLTVTLPYICED